MTKSNRNGEDPRSYLSGFDWLDDLAPSFEIDGNKVDVLLEPREFYNELISLVGQSRRRMIFASLYLGTGDLEQRLISALQSSLENCDALDGGHRTCLRFLLDYSRGTRGPKNSCTMLLPLKQQFGDRVEVALFHTPLLRGFLKRVLPGRWNEIVGVQHMKLYIFDDTLLISGANLSHDYFTNRQDRYIVIRNCPELAEFYSSIVDAISSCSFRLEADGKLKLSGRCQYHPFKDDQAVYCDMMKRRIDAIMSKWRNRQPSSKDVSDRNRLDTRIYALLQMGPIGIDTEDVVTRRILTKPTVNDATFGSRQRMDLASGYFNLTDIYSDFILNRSALNYRILMASPKANGFFNGSGISGYIPAVYVHVSRLFFHAVNRLKQNHRIELFEYFSQGWTFHAKGMWFTISKDDLPSVTLVGSTNYGYRSLHRDLESQLVIVTENARLRHQLKTERDRLFSFGLPINSSTFKRQDHHVPYFVRLVAKLWRHFF